jgi:hypothetical protein
MKQLAIVSGLALATCITGVTATAAAVPLRDPLGPWEITTAPYQTPNLLDFASFEWEYLTVHNEDGNFYGMVGYLLADPRGSAPSGVALVPAGGSMAVAGFFPGGAATAEFLDFGAGNTEFSTTEKQLYAFNPGNGNFGNIEPAAGATAQNPALHASGQSDLYSWDLIITPDFLEYSPTAASPPDTAFSAVRGDDVGLLSGENWTVDAIWSRTRVEGTFRVRATGQVIPIAARGYRENSFGRYLLSIDGWDFALMSDTNKRVQLMLQTYHKSEQLDYFDIGFRDGATPKTVRFRSSRGEMGWYHPSWVWDSRARQCVPQKTWFKAKNAQYEVEMTVSFEARSQAPYAPLLNDSALGTKIFFIMEQFPTFTGTVRRTGSRQLVTTFSGRGGGEFALRKSLLETRSDFGCFLTSAPVFQHPFPN